jgi:hypothetical protein
LGIGRDFIDLLFWLRQSGYLEKHAYVMEIGAQQLANNFLAASAEAERLGPLFDINRPLVLPAPQPTHTLPGGQEHLQPTAPLARIFWQWLEFNHAAIDIDESPGSIPLDLNYDTVPLEEKGKYDLVTNLGTTEHVANQLNAFKLIHELTKLGGVMVHELPAQGMFNHGLINYNPKFFWMLARSNRYKWLHTNFSVGFPHDFPTNIVDEVTKFVPQFSDRVAGYKAADCGILVVVQKIVEMDYVAPLDVNTGTTTENEVLKRRYWTVFERPT